jgi:death-on-curing protein
MTDYLTIADVLAIHKDQIDRYGGADGLRDPGQLEAALFRPQTGYYPDLIAEAAAFWESLSQNHPFVDGNKRTAFAATYTFLVINGVIITADADSLWEFLSHLYKTSSFSFESLDEWLRQNTASCSNNKD